MAVQLTISCPNCKWKPDGEKLWNCQSCGTELDLFADAGRCDQCGFLHTLVSCVSYSGGCDQVSPIMEWYEGLDDGLRELGIIRTDDPD